MGHLIVAINSSCKIDCKLNNIIIRNDKIREIFAGDISLLLIETVNVSITSSALNKLSEYNVKVILCDNKHNPNIEMSPIYGHSNKLGRLHEQLSWEYSKKVVWQEIIKQKLKNQAHMIKVVAPDSSKKLLIYSDEVTEYDKTNREAVAARIYFTALFGTDFTRDKDCIVNAQLNYGYSIILSFINRELCSMGYSTFLGIFHCNQSNQFNLSCDLIEPLRIFVDKIVDRNKTEGVFTLEIKDKLVNVLNLKVKIEDKEYFLSDAIPIYLRNVINRLNGASDYINFISYEL